MKTQDSFQLSAERWTAILTWALVCISSHYFMWASGNFSAAHIALVAALEVGFICAFLLTTSYYSFPGEAWLRPLLIFVQFVLVVSTYWLVPFSYLAILMVIWSGQLLYYMPFRLTLSLSPLWASPLWLIFEFHWQHDYALFTAALFWMFDLFAIVTVNTSLKEQQAKEQAQQLNRELGATQQLLAEAGKQAERTRIARNIHDLLGHHLTALTIKLQVAGRLSEGQAKTEVEQCHALAKLLLSDVREAVSDIRDKSSLAFKDAVATLVRDVPRLNVEIDFDDIVHIQDLQVADHLLRCIQESLTNSLKHSDADFMGIRLQQSDSVMTLTIEDNGKKQGSFTEGNGLKGITERIASIGGQVSFEQQHTGFITRIQLPEPA